MLTPVLCAGAAAVFVYRRSRRYQSQHVSVFSLGAVEEGCLDPTADVDVQEKGEVRTQDAHIVRLGEDWDALPRWSTQVVAAQVRPAVPSRLKVLILTSAADLSLVYSTGYARSLLYPC